MTAGISSTRFRTVVGFALSCLMLLSAGSLSTLSAQANVPLEGIFSIGNWRVRLDDKSGTGVFTAVGNSSRKTGEPFLKVSARSSYNTWRGRAFDKSFTALQESLISINGDVLTITPKTGPAYVLKRIQPAASTGRSMTGGTRTAPAGSPAPAKSYSSPAKTSGRNESGCTSVQCHGTTKAGNRCRRTTTNCSGYCYQH